MAWIESHQKLKDDPRLFDVMAGMNWTKAEAIGRLHMFWWWCVDHAETGDLRSFNDTHLALAVELNPSEGAAFKAAMVKAGFIEKEPYFRLHNWWRFTGRFLQARYKNKDQNRWQNVRDSYDSNSSKNGSSNCSSNSSSTVPPNLTVPNLTEPNEREHAREELAHIPTQEEFRVRFAPIGIPDAYLDAKWAWFEGNNAWLDQHGRLKKYEVLVRQWWATDREKWTTNGTHARKLEVPLDKQLKAVEEQLKEVERRGFEDAFGLKFGDEKDRDEFRELKKRRKALRDQIAKG